MEEMKLKDKLTHLRKEKGLSQIDLAEEMLVSRQAISKWETGMAMPTAENLKVLSELYDVSIDYLLNDNYEETKQQEEVEEEQAGTQGEVKEEPAEPRNQVKDWKKKKYIAVLICILIIFAAVLLGCMNEKEESPESKAFGEMDSDHWETDGASSFSLDW